MHILRMTHSCSLHPVYRRMLALVASVLLVVFGLLLTGDRAEAVDIVVTAEVPGGVEAKIQWAVPELRVGETIFVPGAEPGTNDDTTFYLTVRTSDDGDDVILFTMTDLEITDVDGTYLTSIPLTGISAGTYDIGFKGGAHLTKVLNDVTLVNGPNTLNFTQLDNSAPKGTEVLLGGDINGLGTTPATLGDDVVNSVDLSQLIADLNEPDPTGNAIRANINQDDVVNSVDLSIIIKNLDMEGQN